MPWIRDDKIAALRPLRSQARAVHGKASAWDGERERRGKDILLVVVNHRVELMSMYKGWGFTKTGEESAYPNPRYLAC